MRGRRILRQGLTLLLCVGLFAAFNCSLYLLLTGRLANNFSGATRAQMVDVGAYLPHEPDSDLPRIEADLELTGELPVLDGAAALVPVYAAVIDNLYPEGSVTYVGGTFSDDNYYGENFAPDSKMQYRNTVRGYRAVVDGTATSSSVPPPPPNRSSMPPTRGWSWSICLWVERPSSSSLTQTTLWMISPWNRCVGSTEASTPTGPR